MVSILDSLPTTMRETTEISSFHLNVKYDLYTKDDDWKQLYSLSMTYDIELPKKKDATLTHSNRYNPSILFSVFFKYAVL